MRRVHNHKTILPSSKDSESLRTIKSKRSTEKTYAAPRLFKRVSFFIYELLPALLLLAVPLSVHAGVFSVFMGAFADKAVAQVDLDAVNHSSVNTPLLNASRNPDPQRAIGGGDISFDEGALVSAGPVGEDEIHASKAGTGEISVYVVREGDALSQIAEMYGVTTNTILWANDLESAKDIHAGDSLVILPIVGVKHTVAKGETLGSIVKKYGADLDEVLKYNSLSSVDDLAVGNELIIPGGEIHVAKAVAAVKPTKTTGAKASGAGLINPAPGSIKTQGIHGYNGVDLASKGAAHIPIVAAAAGKVIVSKSSGWNGGYGQYIVIKHSNGTQTLYGHLSKNLVALGDYVDQGQQIGVMGNTGQVSGATGVHLHFEVRGGVNPF